MKMESGTNKSMALLAFVFAGQFSLAHGELKLLDPDTLYTPDGADLPQSTSMLIAPADHNADHNIGLHPSLADDPDPLEVNLTPQHDLVHVDFSSIAGQKAPVTVEGDYFTVGLNGNAQVGTNFLGLPATHWFGDRAKPAFVLVNGSAQITFSQDVNAFSLIANVDSMQPDLAGQEPDFALALINAHGNMIGDFLIHMTTDSPKTLAVPSETPFRSVIISSTAETWMFSNLNYEAEASVSK